MARRLGEGGNDLDPGDILRSLMMKTSARNVYRCTVTAVTESAVSAEVVLDLGRGKTLTATITRDSADALDLRLGDSATALIKSSHVILALP